MAEILTNILISGEPSFSTFECYTAQLLIKENEAWKNRERYNQAMVPSQNLLFFVSDHDLSAIIKEETIEKVSLDSNLDQDKRILRFLAHRALRIKLRDSGLFFWHGFYSSQDSIKTVEGKFGRVYDIFKGIVPRIFFEQGYCMIVFEPKSKVFNRFKSEKKPPDYTKLIGFCKCKDCPERDSCEEVKYQVSEVMKIGKSRITMVNLEGVEFYCPLSQVLVETNRKATAGEYRDILSQTTNSTLEEYEFIHDFVNSIAKGNLQLDLGKTIDFSWLKLE